MTCRDRRHADGGQAGFTLLEMLVVMVIVSLVAGIVLTSYERILDIRIRLAAFIDGTDAPTLIAGWFRESVEGLLPDQKDGADVFVGTPRRLSGLTVAAIDGRPGVPTPMTWEIKFDGATRRTSLTYRNGTAKPMVIASWPGDRGTLQYCGPTLACADHWPATDEGSSQLPALVVLEAVRGDAIWPVAAAPRAIHDPAPKLQPFGGASS